MIEAAINKTNDEKKELTMAQLGEVIKIARDLGKMPKGTTRKYNSISFDMWAKQAADDTKVEIIEDKNDTVAAFLSIADRHADLKGKQELVELEALQLVKIFDQADTPINHLQQATAALAYLNSERETAQIWVVPAGQGKSTIHAALTFLFLKHTDHDIHVVFNDGGLMRKDQAQNEKFTKLCQNAGIDYKRRVRY
jgi:hypothetical protein